jgi:hypothetical protein
MRVRECCKKVKPMSETTTEMLSPPRNIRDNKGFPESAPAFCKLSDRDRVIFQMVVLTPTRLANRMSTSKCLRPKNDELWLRLDRMTRGCFGPGRAGFETWHIGTLWDDDDQPFVLTLGPKIFFQLGAQMPCLHPYDVVLLRVEAAAFTAEHSPADFEFVYFAQASGQCTTRNKQQKLTKLRSSRERSTGDDPLDKSPTFVFGNTSVDDGILRGLSEAISGSVMYTGDALVRISS